MWRISLTGLKPLAPKPDTYDFGKYEASLNEQDARAREEYLKTGMGKRYIKNRLKRFLSLTG